MTSLTHIEREIFRFLALCQVIDWSCCVRPSVQEEVGPGEEKDQVHYLGRLGRAGDSGAPP